MGPNDPPTIPVTSGSWAACPPDEIPITIVRAELVTTDGIHRVSILRELRCGDVVVAGGPVWSRSTEDEVAATDSFEGLMLVGDDLVFLAEAALVLTPGTVDAVVDRHVASAVESREAARIKAVEKAAKAEAKAARDRKIGVYFTGDKKKPVVEMRRGVLSAPFLKLHFGAEWERDRFWDWFAWQSHRHDEIEAKVAELGAEPVRRELLYEMLTTEQAVKKRGLGAGGRRPLLFWRGDL